MQETFGDVGSCASKLPFFGFLRASAGIIDTIGPEKLLPAWAFNLLKFSCLLSRPGLKGWLEKEKEVALGRKEKMLILDLAGFSIQCKGLFFWVFVFNRICNEGNTYGLKEKRKTDEGCVKELFGDMIGWRGKKKCNWRRRRRR